MFDLTECMDTLKDFSQSIEDSDINKAEAKLFMQDALVHEVSEMVDTLCVISDNIERIATALEHIVNSKPE